MKIKELHIYGFGQHVDKIIRLHSGSVHVFFGENEKGKSTIMAFIRAILFGFPSRSQIEARYEPKFASKYGGSLLIETKEHGEIRIERISGKSSGYVNVQLSDGTTVGEEMLAKIFKGLTLSQYQSIFSFDLQGLASIDGLQPEELGKYLFSAGMTANDKLIHVEKKLDQRLEAMFKPNGRKPLLNQLMVDMEKHQSKLYQWEQKLGKYEQLIAEKNTIEGKLTELEHERENNDERLRTIHFNNSLKPYVEEYLKWRYRLDALPQFHPFPEAGMEKIEKLAAQISTIKSQMAVVERKQEENKEKHEEIKVNEHILDQEQRLAAVVENLNVYQHDQRILTQLEFKQSQLEQEIEETCDSLGLTFSKNELLAADTSLAMKERLKNELHKELVFNGKKANLEEERLTTKQRIEEASSNVAFYEEQMLDDQERQKLEDDFQQQVDHESFGLRIEQATLRDQQLQSSLKKHHSRIKGLTLIGAGIAIVLLMLSVILTISYRLESLVAILAATAVILAVVIPIVWQRRLISSDIREINEERKLLKEQLSQYENNHKEQPSMTKSSIQQKLLADDQLRQRLHNIQFMKKEHERSEERLALAQKHLEADLLQVKKEIVRISNECYLPDQLTGNQLLDSLEQIVEMKNKIKAEKKIEKEITRLKSTISNYIDGVTQLAHAFQLNNDAGDDPVLIIERMKALLDHEKENQRIKLELQHRVAELTADINELEVQLNHYKKECELLFRSADVTNEDDFRKRGTAYLEAERIKEHIASIEGQLSAFVKDKDSFIENMKNEKMEKIDYENEIKKAEKKSKQLEIEIQTLQEQLAEVKQSIHYLGGGTDYSEALHEFEMQKSQFQNEANKWAVYQVARDLIKETKAYYQNVRLPKIITRASDYFQFLTKDQYRNIYVLENEEILTVEHTSGIRYKPNELSQATVEQLYLSIRLAFAREYETITPYPIIIDDSFVNFDKERLYQSIDLLQQFSNHHQVLYFTCHTHISESFSEQQIIHL